jgi:hypothetical protein
MGSVLFKFGFWLLGLGGTRRCFKLSWEAMLEMVDGYLLGLWLWSFM